MQVPPYQQLRTVLAYFARALRSDPQLLEWLGSEHNVVASTAEHDPFSMPRKPDGVPRLYATELPLLAIWEEKTAPAPPRGRMMGEVVTLAFLYVFRQPHGGADEGGRPLAREAVAARISKAIWWKVQHYIRVHRLDAKPEPFDLLEDGRITSLSAGEAHRLTGQELEGIMAEMTMVHHQPPWEAPTSTALKLATMELTLPSGLQISGENALNIGE